MDTYRLFWNSTDGAFDLNMIEKGNNQYIVVDKSMQKYFLGFGIPFQLRQNLEVKWFIKVNFIYFPSKLFIRVNFIYLY